MERRRSSEPCCVLRREEGARAPWLVDVGLGSHTQGTGQQAHRPNGSEVDSRMSQGYAIRGVVQGSARGLFVTGRSRPLPRHRGLGSASRASKDPVMSILWPRIPDSWSAIPDSVNPLQPRAG